MESCSSLEARSSSERSQVGSYCSFSLRQSWSCSSLWSRPRSPAQVLASSLMVVPSPVESCLPLNSCVEGPLFPFRDSFLLIPVSCCVCGIHEGVGVGELPMESSLVIRGLLLREVLDLAAWMRTIRRNSPPWTCFLYRLPCSPWTAARDFFREPSVPWLLAGFQLILSSPPLHIVFQLVARHPVSLWISTIVSSPSSGMCSNQLLPFLQYPRVQGEEAALSGAGQSFGIDEWPVAVLHDGYKVPFHHLPPVPASQAQLITPPSAVLTSVESLLLLELLQWRSRLGRIIAISLLLRLLPTPVPVQPGQMAIHPRCWATWHCWSSFFPGVALACVPSSGTSHGRRPSRSDSSVAVVHQDSMMVAPGGQVVVRGSSSGPSPVPAVVYQRVAVGLGTVPIGSDSLEGLVRGRQCGTLQCAWDEGSIIGSICLPASAVGAECHPDGRHPSVVASLQHQGNFMSRVCVSWPRRSPCGSSSV